MMLCFYLTGPPDPVKRDLAMTLIFIELNNPGQGLIVKGEIMKKFTLTILGAAAIWLCTASSSMAGPGVRFGIFVGPPVYYPPAPYYYGPGYYGYYGPHYYGHHRFYGGFHHRR